MKQGIHPEYHKVIFLDTTTNFKFLSGSTKHLQKLWNGKMEMNTSYSFRCIIDSHPFYTGRQNSQQRMVVWNVSTKSLDSNQTTTNFDFNCLLSRLGL